MAQSRMSVFLLLLAFFTLLAGQDNNDFFDNLPLQELGPVKLELRGEIASPGPVSLSTLPLHAVIVREGVLRDGEPFFAGAFRYEGCSLFDILREVTLQKKNAAEFNLPLDLLVRVEGRNGQQAVFSWGEIFYAAVPHRILVAVRASAINPTKAKMNWKTPTAPRLVCATDLFCQRLVEEPTTITVFSAPRSFTVRRDLRPLYSSTVHIFGGDRPAPVGEVKRLPKTAEPRSVPVFFYGRGMGFHGFETFHGARLADVLRADFAAEKMDLRNAYLVVAAPDGYRAALSASEVFNRNDGADILLIDRGVDADGGRFSLYPAADFFSDRALKAVAQIYLDSLSGS